MSSFSLVVNLSLCLSLSLGGYPPFHEDFGNHSITEQIISGEFTMVPSKWRNISDQGTTAILLWYSCNTRTVLSVCFHGYSKGCGEEAAGC